MTCKLVKKTQKEGLTYGVLDTPCSPGKWYAGPIELVLIDGALTWMPSRNDWTLFHRTIELADQELLSWIR
jgi:hypothetical protein